MLPNFHCGNLAMIPKISKPNTIKASKTNANSLFLTTNVQKLKFYQNKGLSLDSVTRCLIPSLHVTNLLNSRIKIFLPVRLRLGKTTFFLA